MHHTDPTEDRTRHPAGARRAPTAKAADFQSADFQAPDRFAASTESGASTDTIVQAVTTAIVEHRIEPGTKLTEAKLGSIFGVSRTVVRQALFQLARDRLVTLEPARGAFVATPSATEARDLFSTRQMLEAGMVERLCDTITDAQIQRLRAHLADEQHAVGFNEVTRRTRLLADFHVVLANMTGNAVLVELMHELVTRTSLITLMYQSARSARHSSAEHAAVVDALERRDARTARKLMVDHLQHVLDNLALDPRVPIVNLREALGMAIANSTPVRVGPAPDSP